MGLGFKWAGWSPIIANDIEPKFLATYSRNIHKNTIEGSLTDTKIFEELIVACDVARAEGHSFWILGGPPCQGFSTAGKKRTMKDPRNHLVWEYLKFLERVQPDGFVFENVTGLLNMQHGKVFAAICEAFRKIMPSVNSYVLSTEKYGIPQRRKRVILVGQSNSDATPWEPPEPFTKLNEAPSLLSPIHAVSVEEAISDLPPLAAGENGNGKTYLCTPRNIYQSLMRGFLQPREYIARLKQGDRECKYRVITKNIKELT